VTAPPDRFQGFEIDELVDGDTDIAQRKPDEIERGEAEEQCVFARVPGRHRRLQRKACETDEAAGEHDQAVKQNDRRRMRRHGYILAQAEVAVAQAHEEDLGGAEIEQPQRDAQGADQDENREALGAQNAREHEGLHQTGRDGRHRRGRAQEEIAQRQDAAQQPQGALQSGFHHGKQGRRGHGRNLAGTRP